MKMALKEETLQTGLVVKAQTGTKLCIPCRCMKGWQVCTAPVNLPNSILLRGMWLLVSPMFLL